MTIPIATVLPLLFISNELNEARAARQSGGHALVGSIFAVAIGIAFAAAFALIAWALLKFAVKGRL